MGESYLYCAVSGLIIDEKTPVVSLFLSREAKNRSRYIEPWEMHQILYKQDAYCGFGGLACR